MRGALTTAVVPSRTGYARACGLSRGALQGFPVQQRIEGDAIVVSTRLWRRGTGRVDCASALTGGGATRPALYGRKGCGRLHHQARTHPIGLRDLEHTNLGAVEESGPPPWDEGGTASGILRSLSPDPFSQHELLTRPVISCSMYRSKEHAREGLSDLTPPSTNPASKGVIHGVNTLRIYAARHRQSGRLLSHRRGMFPL